MRECHLKQSDLVELLGVSLSRVKAMTSGRVKNLTREESEALIRKLHIRGDWLATGEGPMLQSDGEREMARRIDLLKLAAGKAQIEGLEPHHMRALQEILFFAELGDATALRRALTQLQPDERALVGSYRSCSDEAKVSLIQQAAVFAAGIPSKASTTSAPVKRALQRQKPEHPAAVQQTVDAEAPAGAQPKSIKVSSKHGHAAGRDVNVNSEESNGKGHKPQR